MKIMSPCWRVIIEIIIVIVIIIIETVIFINVKLVKIILFYLFIYLFGVLRHFQHYTGHITTGSFVGRGNQYIQLVSRFCTVNCRPTASNYQLSHLRPYREPNPGLRGGRRECYHSATVAPKNNSNALESKKGQSPKTRQSCKCLPLRDDYSRNRYIYFIASNCGLAGNTLV